VADTFDAAQRGTLEYLEGKLKGFWEYEVDGGARVRYKGGRFRFPCKWASADAQSARLEVVRSASLVHGVERARKAVVVGASPSRV
jgi:hypothetical protein